MLTATRTLSALQPHAAACHALWQLDATKLQRLYAAGEVSPVEVLASVHARMAQVDPKVHAMVAQDQDQAVAQAQASAARWRAGQPWSALDGVPLTIKDNLHVQGLPCTWGSALYRDHQPTHDEGPVHRLRAAGMVLLGKTNVPEFTLLGYTDNRLHGCTRNPWDLRLTPGGSSGGAVAAVASGIGPVALATDGGGSIRRPCAHTGLVGLKPSAGRVPRAGGLPDVLSGMEVVGPIARCVSDLVALLQVLGGAAPADVANLPQQPPRIAYWRTLADHPVDSQVLAACDAQAEHLQALGCTVVAEAAPAEVDAFNQRAWPVLSATGLAQMLAPHAQRQGVAAVEAQMTEAMVALWQQGRRCTAADLQAAQQVVQALRHAMQQYWQCYDWVLTPCAAALPWPATQTHPSHIAGQPVGPRGHAVFTAFVNACGLPALALPAGTSREGWPIGLQLVGRAHSDDALLALGQQLQQRGGAAWQWPALTADAIS